jgi:hypothetical protein
MDKNEMLNKSFLLYKTKSRDFRRSLLMKYTIKRFQIKINGSKDFETEYAMCKKIGYFMTPELALSSTYHNYCMI